MNKNIVLSYNHEIQQIMPYIITGFAGDELLTYGFRSNDIGDMNTAFLFGDDYTKNKSIYFYWEAGTNDPYTIHWQMIGDFHSSNAIPLFAPGEVKLRFSTRYGSLDTQSIKYTITGGGAVDGLDTFKATFTNQDLTNLLENNIDIKVYISIL